MVCSSFISLRLYAVQLSFPFWVYVLNRTLSGSLLLNEIAPRPHNSGHYTIEACECSQYENHLRAILGLPLGSTKLKVGAAVMLNILGPAAKPKSSHSLGIVPFRPV